MAPRRTLRGDRVRFFGMQPSLMISLVGWGLPWTAAALPPDSLLSARHDGAHVPQLRTTLSSATAESSVWNRPRGRSTLGPPTLATRVWIAVYSRNSLAGSRLCRIAGAFSIQSRYRSSSRMTCSTHSSVDQRSGDGPVTACCGEIPSTALSRSRRPRIFVFASASTNITAVKFSSLKARWS